MVVFCIDLLWMTKRKKRRRCRNCRILRIWKKRYLKVVLKIVVLEVIPGVLEEG